MKKLTLALLVLYISQSVAHAQDSLEVSNDCTDVQVDYSNDSTLTQDERINRMDQAFNNSLNKFELCQSEAEKKAKMEMINPSSCSKDSASCSPSSKTEDTPTGGAVASSVVSGTELSEGNAVARDKSKASSVISGTELAKGNSIAGDKGKEPKINPVVQTTDNENNARKINVSLQNGKPPDDIPSADNDSALAAQIRRAAENETDPIKREQLWDEYRKYKGLTQ